MEEVGRAFARLLTSGDDAADMGHPILVLRPDVGTGAISGW